MSELQAAAKEILRRRNARKNLIDFIRFINPDYIISDFSRSVCSAIEEFHIDVQNGIRPIVELEAPPQHGKSDIVSRYLPAWLLGNNPHLAFTGASYSSDLAKAFCADVKRIMTSEEYQQLFPSVKINQKTQGNQSKAIFDSQKFQVFNTETKKIGLYRAVGRGQGLTGRRTDIMVLDDLLKDAKEAFSETVKRTLWDWYLSVADTRFSKLSGRVIMATRWASDDLSGRVMDATPDRVKRLTFKAICDDGNALVPELHPIEKLIETRDMLIQTESGRYFWSAMYQQNPVAMGGNFINTDHLLVDGLPVDMPKFCLNVYAVIDTAMKDGAEHDSTAVVYAAYIDIPEPRVIILDYDAVSINGAFLIDWLPLVYARLEALSEQCKPRGGSMAFVEDKGSGTVLLQQAIRKDLRIRALPSDFVALGKTGRGLEVSGAIYSGKVKITEYAYNKTIRLKGRMENHLISQITTFKLGTDNKTDDLFDGFCYAINLGVNK